MRRPDRREIYCVENKLPLDTSDQDLLDKLNTKTKPEVEKETDFQTIAENKSKRSQDVQIINVGDPANFNYGGVFGPNQDNAYVNYCGMIGKDTFSLGEQIGHGALNIYYPTNAEEIQFEKHRFRVLNVSPESIELDHSICPKRED